MNQGRRDSSDQVGDEGARVIAVGLLLPCGSGGGGGEGDDSVIGWWPG